MKTVLITGAGPTGVSGRAIKEYLEKDYEILAPSSKVLDLTDDVAVKEYFNLHKIDYVVHCATYRSNISNTMHLVDEELESNLRMYYSLAKMSDKFEKMVYLGSGAEYDKTREIVNFSEDCFGEQIPKGKYGLGKYIMNTHCRVSRNIYNLRMFGTLNPYERYTKNVVCNLCVKAVMSLPLSLKQDVRFSWVDITDVAKAIKYLFEHNVTRHDYNIALSQSYKLSEIATLIIGLNQTQLELCIENEGLNKEYSCCTNNFKKDFNIQMAPVVDSVKHIYNYWFSHKELININDIDGRWK